MLEQLRAIPGVKLAGTTTSLPMSGSNQSGSFNIEGQPQTPGQDPPHGSRWLASEDYFETMNIKLVRGRLFNSHDTADAQQVAIVDETLARKYWGTEDPVGKRITFEGPDDKPRWREIVGLSRTFATRGSKANRAGSITRPMRKPQGAARTSTS